jgi:uncharacterized cupin superfamily protein
MATTWPYKFNVHTVEPIEFPEYGGSRAMLYSSADRRRIAGSFREQGTYEHTQPFDEFIYCIAGSGRVTIAGYDPIDVAPGDFLFINEGSQVIVQWDEGFTDVAILVSDRPIEDL